MKEQLRKSEIRMEGIYPEILRTTGPAQSQMEKKNFFLLPTLYCSSNYLDYPSHPPQMLHSIFTKNKSDQKCSIAVIFKLELPTPYLPILIELKSIYRAS